MTKPNLDNAVIVLDMDGVLNKFDFGELQFKIVQDHEWAELTMLKDTYYFVRKTCIFDSLIESKSQSDLYVLSAALTSYEQNSKIAFLNREYPKINKDNVIFVGDAKFKIDILKGLRKILDKTGKEHMDLVMIEDTVSVLSDITKLNDDRIKCYLLSDFV